LYQYAEVLPALDALDPYRWQLAALEEIWSLLTFSFVFLFFFSI